MTRVSTNPAKQIFSKFPGDFQKTFKKLSVGDYVYDDTGLQRINSEILKNTMGGDGDGMGRGTK